MDTANSSSVVKNQMRQVPAIVKFKIGDLYCIYDAWSNKLFRCDKLASEILSLYGLPNENIIRLLRKEYPARRIRAALRNISETKKNNTLNGFPLPFTAFGSGFSPHNTAAVLFSRLVLEITEQCNFRCRYCVYGGAYASERFRSHSNNVMKYETARKAVDYFAHHCEKGARIGFYGGEPLLQFGMIGKLIAYIKDKHRHKNFLYNITTNASVLTAKIIRYMAAHNIDLNISLDGPARLHDKYRVYANGRPTHADIINKIRLIKDIDGRYFRNHVSFRATYPPGVNKKKIYDFFNQNLFADIKGAIVLSRTGSGADENPHFPLADSQAVSAVNSIYIRKMRDKLINNIMRLDPLALKKRLMSRPAEKIIAQQFHETMSAIHARINKPGKIGRTIYPNKCCIPSQASIMVDTRGRYFMCEKIAERYQSIGDVHSGIDWKIVKKIMDDYAKISLPHCRYCWAFRFCHLCFVHALEKGKLSEQKKLITCENERAIIKKDLALYCKIMLKDPAILRKLTTALER